MPNTHSVFLTTTDNVHYAHVVIHEAIEGAMVYGTNVYADNYTITNNASGTYDVEFELHAELLDRAGFQTMIYSAVQCMSSFTAGHVNVRPM